MIWATCVLLGQQLGCWRGAIRICVDYMGSDPQLKLFQNIVLAKINIEVHHWWFTSFAVMQSCYKLFVMHDMWAERRCLSFACNWDDFDDGRRNVDDTPYPPDPPYLHDCWDVHFKHKHLLSVPGQAQNWNLECVAHLSWPPNSKTLNVRISVLRPSVRSSCSWLWLDGNPINCW